MDTSSFDETKAFREGLKVRTEVLGEAHVARALETAGDDPFTHKFQQFAIEYGWGTTWCSDVLDRKAKSLMNLCLLTGLGREPELRLHVRGAINNGLTKDEIAEAFLHTAIYAGAPAASAAFRVAKEVFDEMEAEQRS